MAEACAAWDSSSPSSPASIATTARMAARSCSRSPSEPSATRLPGCGIEVLVPDFQGSHAAMDMVLEAAPDVLNHNTETVPRLYRQVRLGARYERSLDMLAYVKTSRPEMPTKSGLMLGLGRNHRRSASRDARPARRPTSTF